MSKIKRSEFDDLLDRVGELEDKLSMPHIYSSSLYTGLYERTTALWAKFSRLYDYLNLEDVTDPERKYVRKRSKGDKL